MNESKSKSRERNVAVAVTVTCSFAKSPTSMRNVTFSLSDVEKSLDLLYLLVGDQGFTDACVYVYVKYCA